MVGKNSISKKSVSCNGESDCDEAIHMELGQTYAHTGRQLLSTSTPD